MFTLINRDTFDIETLVRRGETATTTREYNADLRRLLPWPGHVNSKRPVTEFGSILVTIRPFEDVEAHRHDEEELFIIIAGEADLEIERQTTRLGVGDVVYIPRYWMHQLRNPNTAPFTFIDLYWDDKGRSFETFAASEVEEVV